MKKLSLVVLLGVVLFGGAHIVISIFSAALAEETATLYGDPTE